VLFDWWQAPLLGPWWCGRQEAVRLGSVGLLPFRLPSQEGSQLLNGS
jgi:hypothetical protein